MMRLICTLLPNHNHAHLTIFEGLWRVIANEIKTSQQNLEIASIDLFYWSNLFCFRFQPYFGKYKTPTQVSQQAKEVQEANPVPGMLAAVYLQDYTFNSKRKVSRASIGTVIEVLEDSVKIRYLKGDWAKQWVEYPKPWEQWIPKKSIVLYDFSLEDGKLRYHNRKEIKKHYETLRDLPLISMPWYDFTQHATHEEWVNGGANGIYDLP